MSAQRSAPAVDPRPAPPPPPRCRGVIRVRGPAAPWVGRGGAANQCVAAWRRPAVGAPPLIDALTSVTSFPGVTIGLLRPALSVKDRAPLPPIIVSLHGHRFVSLGGSLGQPRRAVPCAVGRSVRGSARPASRQAARPGHRGLFALRALPGHNSHKARLVAPTGAYWRLAAVPGRLPAASGASV